jgi:hypothetical protein
MIRQGSESNPFYTRQQGSNIMQPTDIQSVYAKPIQTHNNVTVSASTEDVSAQWEEAIGFSKISLTVSSDAPHAMKVSIHWSHDKLTWHGEDIDVIDTTNQRDAGTTQVKADFFKVAVLNGDASSHDITTFAYLSTN